MIHKIIQYISLFKQINVVRFLYLNFICKSVVRLDNSKIIPYKNAVLDLSRDSIIYLSGGDIEVGCDLMNKSKTETRIRMREGAIWCSVGGCKISYGSTIEVLSDAVLECGYFTMNSNSTMIVAEKVSFGEDVMIGRNVVIYDSDYHQIVNNQGQVMNYSAPVVIESHVWLATNVMILKGTIVGMGSVIGANVTVSGRIPKHMIVTSESKYILRKNDGSWNRKFL
jgi:acetyltransferase-like isoleucine patch superfamily enzyme